MKEAEHARKSIRFWVTEHPSPRFWMAEARSRKTKVVKVCDGGTGGK